MVLLFKDTLVAVKFRVTSKNVNKSGIFQIKYKVFNRYCLGNSSVCTGDIAKFLTSVAVLFIISDVVGEFIWLWLKLLSSAEPTSNSSKKEKFGERIQMPLPYINNNIYWNYDFDQVVVKYGYEPRGYGYGYGYAPKKVKVVEVEKVEEVEQKPQAYAFSYDITDDEYNSNGRQESGDEYGNMKGSYSIKLSN
ncbi:hypothetical protein GQR58_029436 [Nymphon striatum]|nr:hypothetical protein GQR58_029436 [Nymphon striatum]